MRLVTGSAGDTIAPYVAMSREATAAANNVAETAPTTNSPRVSSNAASGESCQWASDAYTPTSTLQSGTRRRSSDTKASSHCWRVAAIKRPRRVMTMAFSRWPMHQAAPMVSAVHIADRIHAGTDSSHSVTSCLPGKASHAAARAGKGRHDVRCGGERIGARTRDLMGTGSPGSQV